jgi:hypothetical protein
LAEIALVWVIWDMHKTGRIIISGVEVLSNKRFMFYPVLAIIFFVISLGVYQIYK